MLSEIFLNKKIFVKFILVCSFRSICLEDPPLKNCRNSLAEIYISDTTLILKLNGLERCDLKADSPADRF